MQRFSLEYRLKMEFVDVFWSHAGLQILYTLLQNVSGEETAAQSFYQTYFCDVLQHIFSVVTDTSHTAGKTINVPNRCLVRYLTSCKYP